jgi:acyl-CoA synthetase (AMP-forming)/AMP-acid ligase II
MSRMSRPLLDYLDRAATTSGRVEFVATPSSHAFADLWRVAHRRAAWLTKRMAGSPRIAGVLEPTPESLTTLLAAWLAGKSFVSLPRPGRAMGTNEYLAQIESLLELAEVDQLVLPAGLAEAIDQPGCLRYHEVGELSPVTGSGHGELIQFTSGSTGRPRGVCLSMRDIGANVAATAQRLQYRDDDVFFSWLPLSHDMGLIGMCVGPMAAFAPELGGVQALWLVSPDTFARNPGSWLELGSTVGGSVTMTPNLGVEIAVRKLRFSKRLNLSSIRCLVVGSDTVQPDTLRRFTEAAAAAGFRPVALCPGYGLAEATLVVTMESPREMWTSSPVSGTYRDSVAVGRPLEGVEVRVEELQEYSGHIGEIQVRAPSVASEFIGSATPVEGGWLHTEDLGFIEDDRLHFVSRAAERIVVGGRNLNAVDVERALCDVAGVRPGCCAAVATDDTHYVVVAEPTQDDAPLDDMRRLSRSIANEAVQRFGVGPRRVYVIARGSLPKTPSGKVARSRLAELVAANAVEALADMADGARANSA